LKIKKLKMALNHKYCLTLLKEWSNNKKRDNIKYTSKIEPTIMFNRKKNFCYFKCRLAQQTHTEEPRMVIENYLRRSMTNQKYL